MRVEVKQLDKSNGRCRWKPLPAKKLLGLSIVDYMLGCEEDIIAALFKTEEDGTEKPYVFVSNKTQLVDEYNKRGLAIHAQEIKDFLGTTLVPPLVAYTLDGAVSEVRPPEKKEEKFYDKEIHQ